ncbi:hypothetical protein FDF13_09015 [Brevibacterium sp. CS2]|nr:hypothetical protein FDF13_09015 [Brevibacterium sp. CS2]
MNTEHTEQNPNLDPDPRGDADLEPGGGVRPGDTPPESQSATSTPPHQPEASSSGSKGPVIAIVLVVAALVFLFIAYAVGIFGS